MELRIINPIDWKLISRGIHSLVFNENRLCEDRIDYAILMVKNGEAAGYATVIETDSETAYLQYGGALPEFRGSALAYRGLVKIIDYLKQKYKHIYTKVHNENTVFLKMCLNIGYKIVGTVMLRNQNNLFVELYLAGGI